MKTTNVINQYAAENRTDSSSIPLVQGRTVLMALVYSVGIAASLGLLTGFGLPRIVPALGNTDWLATIIATEIYLAFIAGHVIAFGGLRTMRRKLQLGNTSWRSIGVAFGLWLATWILTGIFYLALRPFLPVVADMGQAILKVGSLFGRLDRADPALLTLALIQPILITPLAEEILFRGSLYGWLRGKFRPAVVILITAALFAVYHPLVSLWPVVFFFGLASGWLREQSRSLTPFLVMHIFNSMAMIAAAYVITGWRV